MSPKFGIRELPKMPEFGGCEMRGDIGRTPIKTRIMKHAMPLFLAYTKGGQTQRGGLLGYMPGQVNHHLYKRFGGVSFTWYVLLMRGWIKLPGPHFVVDRSSIGFSRCPTNGAMFQDPSINAPSQQSPLTTRWGFGCIRSPTSATPHHERPAGLEVKTSRR